MVSNLQPCYSLGTEQSPSVEFFHTPFHTFHTIPHCATYSKIFNNTNNQQLVQSAFSLARALQLYFT